MDNPVVTREDLAKLLKSIGKPGEKRQEKIEAVKKLEKTNFQGHNLEDNLDSYAEY